MKVLELACGIALAITHSSFAQDKIIERLGPVEASEPVLTNLGQNAVIAFYYAEDGKCAVQVLTWHRADTEAKGASRSRLSLSPEQRMHLDSIEESFVLQCGQNASSIMLIPPVVSAGIGAVKIEQD